MNFGLIVVMGCIVAPLLVVSWIFWNFMHASDVVLMVDLRLTELQMLARSSSSADIVRRAVVLESKFTTLPPLCFYNARHVLKTAVPLLKELCAVVTEIRLAGVSSTRLSARG